ncbi:hypothetical protein P7K49_030193, partial [Saguinus oedipus]
DVGREKRAERLKDQLKARSEKASCHTNCGFVPYSPKKEAELDPMVTGSPRVCSAQDLQTQYHYQGLQVLQPGPFIQVPPQ